MSTKKFSLIVITLAALALFMVAAGQKNKKPPVLKQQKERRLIVTLNDNTWDLLLFVMDNSSSPHVTVKSVRDSLFKQFNDTTINKK